ncbi:ATP-binding protein [Flagellimonas sp. HMM57]|uniref:AAA family ATPase n=1 Tax=unclassified Flagellimonas TaxID=2644544 RepID=UPI0013D31491|nr:MULTISPECIES: ATP-binding protein [unclassified Flagellimonas]UII76077.1 ATP-binding protein [Flagellimonas sp. HMM57]
MSTKKVVITGAPGTGKTSIINDLESKGFHCFHEIIRDMTSEAKMNGESNEFISNPLLFVDDAMQFNKDLLYGRAKHHEESQRLNVTLSFFDRGVPDVLAYMDFFEQAYREDFVAVCKKHRYDAIFIVPPWKEIYISDNERLETFEEAEKIHDALMKTYTRFEYEPIIVPKKPVSQRTAFVLETLKSN